MDIDKIYNEDCLVGMERIPEHSIDCIICDLPYGITQNKWDIPIPFEELWKQYYRIIKLNGAIVLFGAEPFVSMLISSNITDFKYNWIWQKNRVVNFLNAKKQPLNDHELISVFYQKQCTYNPQMTKADKLYKRGLVKDRKSDNYGQQKIFIQQENGFRFPKRIISFNSVSKILHPTQKPVELIEYLIRTYTKEGETVLDNCIGSGTTAIACINTNRHYIGFEKEKNTMILHRKE